MLKKLLYLVLFFVFMGFIAAEFVAPYAIIKPRRAKTKVKPERYKLTYDTLALLTKDSFKLSNYVVHPATTNSKGTFLLLHGIGGIKEHFLGLAKMLSKEGYRSVLYDSRAMGKSEGAYCSYGFYEKQDAKLIVDSLVVKYPGEPILIWGNSFGGAVALQAMEYDKRIQLGIIESTFAELRIIVQDYAKRITGIGLGFFTNRSLNRAGSICGFDPDKISPIDAARNITQPVFLAHGDADPNINVENGKRIFEALGSAKKELLLVKNGRHEGLSETHGSDYFPKILDFIEKNLP